MAVHIQPILKANFNTLTDYKAKRTKHHGTPFDSDAFDSMAVMNSEMWNEGESDQSGLSREDILTVVGVTQCQHCVCYS